MKKMAVPVAPKMSAVLHLHGGRTDGFHKFRVAHKEEISKAVKEERDKKNISHLMVLPMFQERLSAMWKKLSPSDREGWENFVGEEMDDASAIYECVDLILGLCFTYITTLTAIKLRSPRPCTPSLPDHRGSVHTRSAIARTSSRHRTGIAPATSRPKCTFVLMYSYGKLTCLYQRLRRWDRARRGRASEQKQTN